MVTKEKSQYFLHIQEAYADLGLNERQIQILAGAVPKMQYYFESSRGNALFDMGLGPIGLTFSAASSSSQKKNLKRLRNKKSAPKPTTLKKAQELPEQKVLALKGLPLFHELSYRDGF